MQRTVHYSGDPVKAMLLPERSKLTANGRDSIVVAVRFLDKDEHQAREGLLGDYAVDPPYVSKQRMDDLQKSPLVTQNSELSRYRIGEDGMAMIELAPTTQTGEVVLHFRSPTARPRRSAPGSSPGNGTGSWSVSPRAPWAMTW